MKGGGVVTTLEGGGLLLKGGGCYYSGGGGGGCYVAFGGVLCLQKKKKSFQGEPSQHSHIRSREASYHGGTAWARREKTLLQKKCAKKTPM